MKCPKCGKELELQKKQVGTDENGQPVMNEYAICRDCKKKWNLDKKRTQTPKKSVETNSEESSIDSESTTDEDSTAISANDSTSESISDDTSEAQRYSNIPAEEVRAKRERVMKKSYDEMLATDPARKSTHKKKPAEKKPAGKKSVERTSAPAKRRPTSPSSKEAPSRKRTKPQAASLGSTTASAPKKTKVRAKKVRFKVLRILLGIVSILAAAYFGVLCGLDNIAQGDISSIGIVGLVLALCLLVAGLLSICMKNVKNILAFLLPIIFYIASAAYTFFNMNQNKILMQGAITAAALGLICLILMLISSALDNRSK